MKQNKVQIVLIAASMLFALIALILVFKPNFALPKKTTFNIDIAKNSVVVTDGEYVYYTSPEGNIMKMHAFDKEGELYIERRTIMALGDKHFAVKEENGFSVFNFEEKGIEKTYNIKTDNVDIQDGIVYYKHPETKQIMKIDMATDEESVALGYEVEKFVVTDEGYTFAPAGKKKGIAFVSFDGSKANLYAQNVTVSNFILDENLLFYCDGDNKDCLNYLNLSTGLTFAEKKIKNKRVCVAKGVYFSPKKGGKSKDILVVDDSNAYR